MKRLISIMAVLILLATPVMAQQVQDKAAQPVAAKTMADGMVAGQMIADTKGTGGSFAGGLAGGLFLGLIGTAIAYVAQGPSDLPAANVIDAQKFGSDYTLGLQQGFAERSKSKKKKAALGGGLLGTAALVVLVVNAGGS